MKTPTITFKEFVAQDVATGCPFSDALMAEISAMTEDQCKYVLFALNGALGGNDLLTDLIVEQINQMKGHGKCLSANEAVDILEDWLLNPPENSILENILKSN